MLYLDFLLIRYLFFILRTYAQFIKRQNDKKQGKSTKKSICTKSEFVFDYIIKDTFQANPIADRNGVCSTSGSNRLVKELPYRSAEDYYKEFVTTKTSEGWTPEKLPSRSTFIKVLQDKYHKLPCVLRFLRCKGAHASCDICVNASKLLENINKKLDQAGK